MNYKIMHRQQVIAVANDNSITQIICKELCPACFVEGMDIAYWLNSRYVDVHRSHSRRLFKALRLKTDAPLEEIISIGHGISITDNWYIQKETESLDYDKLKSYNEELSNIALNGSPSKQNFDLDGYTELGTVGSFEKAWRYSNGSWYLFKQGNKAELVSEYYAYSFLKALSLPVAEYSVFRSQSELGIVQECIVSKDFTNNGFYDFEPFFNYFDDNEDFNYIIPKLNEIEKRYPNKHLLEDYVVMCFCDALLFNVDRHNQNIGFLRDSQSGQILSLAPAFDYNLSLASTKVPVFGKSGDLMAYFIKNDDCMSIIDNIVPEKNMITDALQKAEQLTLSAFGDTSLNLSPFSEYIISAYDYYSSARQKYPYSGIKEPNDTKQI